MNVLEKKVTHHKGGYSNKCSSCYHEFDVGEKKYMWRLGIPHSNHYLRGQFWTLQCADCVIRTKDDWIESLNSLEV